VSGERAFDAAFRFLRGLSVGEQALVVGLCLVVVVDALERDHVQRPVQLAVTAAVESVAALLSAGCLQRVGASKRREGCLGRHPRGIAA